MPRPLKKNLATAAIVSTFLVLATYTSSIASAPDKAVEDLWHSQCEKGDQAEISRNYRGAEKSFREAYITAKTFGEASKQMLTSTARVGTIVVLQGRLQDAETFFHQALNIIETTRKGAGTAIEPDPDAMVWLDDFSDAYQAMATKISNKDAYCLEHCIALRNAIAPGRHSKLAMACRDLSLVYIHAERYAEAEKVINLQITAIQHQYGKKTELFAPLGNLAIVQEKLKKYAQADKNMTAAMIFMEQANVSAMYRDAYKRDLQRIHDENLKSKASK